MNEPIETVIIRGQQKFDLYDVLNPVQIQINNDRILNTLKNTNTFTTSCPYLHFISVICNKRYQANIFVTCRTLNEAKIVLINGKIYNILGIINLNKINDWEYIKGKSLWVNVNFDGADQINNSEHIYFSFMTSSLNDLLDFSINLNDDDNKAIEFNSGEKKYLF